MPDPASAPDTVRRLQQQLLSWLLDDAYPLWSTAGWDGRTGIFAERLDQAGASLPEPRRARVPPRQIYAFAQAQSLGWTGDGGAIAKLGLATFLERYRRPDGLFRTLVAPDGTVLDDTAWLYDQAFVLLAFAAMRDAGVEADRLHQALIRHLKRPGDGFDSGLPGRLPLLANPHMHLFESCLAWLDLGEAEPWRSLADDIGMLALTKLINPDSGALRETFDAHWAPEAGLAGRIVEPGHQFEWAWLLLRWGTTNAALGLIEIGEAAGTRDGVTVNALLDDLSIHDAAARLWPQTERLKASALAASITGEARYWDAAASAATTLLRYLDTPVRGLWHDRMNADGNFIEAPAPASNFYHIVAAIVALTEAVNGPSKNNQTGGSA
jgi:mannose-6-phosphate isomerase